MNAPARLARETAFQDTVRLEAVQKYFGAVHALCNIDMAVGRNEIVGLIGDNGAGKSTLIKTLTGVYKPTSGRIFVRDAEIDLSGYSVETAHGMSIETVYQDKSLGEKQPLWRNVFVGRQITNRLGFIDVKKQKAIAEDILLNTIGLRGAGISVDSTVNVLSVGERQGIAIGRAMHFNSDLIVLDRARPRRDRRRDPAQGHDGCGIDRISHRYSVYAVIAKDHASYITAPYAAPRRRPPDYSGVCPDPRLVHVRVPGGLSGAKHLYDVAVHGTAADRARNGPDFRDRRRRNRPVVSGRNLILRVRLRDPVQGLPSGLDRGSGGVGIGRPDRSHQRPADHQDGHSVLYRDLRHAILWSGMATVLSGGKSYALRGAEDTNVWAWIVGRFGDPASYASQNQISILALRTLLIVVLMWFILNRHRFGEHVLLIGDTNDVSRVVGINVAADKIKLYTLMGALASVAAMMLTLENKNFFGNQGQGYLLTAIAAVLIGGTSIFGGRATVVGTVFGCFIIWILEAGLVATGLTGAWVRTVQGIIFLISIIFYLFADEPHRHAAFYARFNRGPNSGRPLPTGATPRPAARVQGGDNPRGRGRDTC